MSLNGGLMMKKKLYLMSSDIMEYASLVLSHEDLESIWGESIPQPSTKGYPPIFNDMIYWVLFVDDKPCAYTGSMIIDNFAFVGNTYVRKQYRSKGFHSLLLSIRNNSDMLRNFTKVTILNPIEDSKIEHLIKVVSKLGYSKINTYGDISDIMSIDTYNSIVCYRLQIWRKDCEH
jgi:hypothetical protein